MTTTHTQTKWTDRQTSPLTSEPAPQLGVTKQGGTLHEILKKRVHIVTYGEVSCRPVTSLNINVVPKLNETEPTLHHIQPASSIPHCPDWLAEQTPTHQSDLSLALPYGISGL